MEVVDHGPYAWYLVRDGDTLFIEALCSHSAADYTVVLQLDAFEVRAYALRGRDYLNELAQAIHYSAPGVRGTTSRYQDRLASAPRAREVSDAIKAWVQAR